MDFTIIYIILIVALTIGLILVGKYVREKQIIKSEDLTFAVSVLQLSTAIVSELKLDKEKEIKTISQIVVSAVTFVNNSTNVSDINQTALDYALNLCVELKLEVTDERKTIIKQLIDLTLSSRLLN